MNFRDWKKALKPMGFLLLFVAYLFLRSSNRINPYPTSNTYEFSLDLTPEPARMQINYLNITLNFDYGTGSLIFEGERYTNDTSKNSWAKIIIPASMRITNLTLYNNEITEGFRLIEGKDYTKTNSAPQTGITIEFNKTAEWWYFDERSGENVTSKYFVLTFNGNLTPNGIFRIHSDVDRTYPSKRDYIFKLNLGNDYFCENNCISGLQNALPIITANTITINYPPELYGRENMYVQFAINAYKKELQNKKETWKNIGISLLSAAIVFVITYFKD